MFSGIIESLASIYNLNYINQCAHLIIQSHINLDDVKVGDSLSINGVCLTVTQCENPFFHVTVVPETLEITSLKFLQHGDIINLERSLQVGARIGGHFVQGHVDTIGTITELKSVGDALLATIKIPSQWIKYIVKKGFICIDGMSITVIDVLENAFTVTFIPHTQAVTRTHAYQIGTIVNIEVDILSKTIEKFIGAYQI